MAAVIVDGCQSKGVSCFAKHMFANVQEYNRADYGGVCTFATEQVFREIYQRSFEWMVKYGHTNGMMTSFNRVGYVVNSNNWAVHEELLRNEWGFTGATVDDAWAKDFVSCDLMLRAGDDTLMGSDTAHKCYVTVGQWDASLRDGKGDVLCPTEDGDDTFESTTHYYAMRKSAQRIQQAKVNSNQYKNFASDFELTATVSYGLANAAQIACAETTDFNVTLAEGQELPAGMTASGFVVSYDRPIVGQYQPGDAEYKTGWTADNNIYGEYPAQGTYEVLVDIECDGYISAQNVKLTINVVSPYTVNGEVLAAANGENPVVTVKSGEQTELVITSETLAYQAFLTTGGFMPKEITNWYVMNGSRYLRNEEKTHADGVTIAIEPVVKHIVFDAKRARTVLDEIGSPNLQILLDPVNLLNMENVDAREDVFAEAIELLGKDVAMIHFKDFLRQDAGGQLAATGAGQGGMGDYRTILRFAKEQKPYVFATLENTTPENAVQCLQYLQKQYDAC